MYTFKAFYFPSASKLQSWLFLSKNSDTYLNHKTAESGLLGERFKTFILIRQTKYTVDNKELQTNFVSTSNQS